MAKINETLRQLRAERGMTQEEVAEQVGLTRQAVSGYEAGRTQPGVDILQRLADIYQVELTDIIYGRNQGVRLYNGLKITAIVIAAVLLAMQLAGAVFLWVANRFYPLAPGLLDEAGKQVLAIRSGLMNAWTALDGVCSGVFPLCCVALLVLTLCLRRPLSARVKCLCTLGYAAASMVVILPWALSDTFYPAVNYLITPATCLLWLAFFLLLSLIIDLVRARRQRGGGDDAAKETESASRAPLLRRWWFWAAVGAAVLLVLVLLFVFWPRGTAELPPVEDPAFSLNGEDYPKAPVMQNFLDRGWKRGKALGWTGKYSEEGGVSKLVCTSYRLNCGENHVDVSLMEEDVRSGLKPEQCRLASLSLYGSNVMSFAVDGKELSNTSGEELTSLLGGADSARTWNGGYKLYYTMPELGISSINFSFPPGNDAVGQILVAFDL